MVYCVFLNCDLYIWIRTIYKTINFSSTYFQHNIKNSSIMWNLHRYFISNSLKYTGLPTKDEIYKVLGPLHCTALHFTALHCTALHFTALHCTALHCTALHCTALHFTALHCTALHCTTLHCTSLHYTALHCTALHCTALKVNNEVYSIFIIPVICTNFFLNY